MKAVRALSQNFLVDPHFISTIIDAIHPFPDETIVEIGPGLGAWTGPLLESGAHVIAIEKDRRLIAPLQKQFPTLTLIEGDILSVYLEELLPKDKKCKVVGNLPYQITTPILTHLLPMQHLFSSLTLMVQKEVAERITATSGSSHMGTISYFIHHYAEAQMLFKIPKKDSSPEPKVDSALVRLDLRHEAIDYNKNILKLIKVAYQKRRKMVRSSLKGLLSPQEIEGLLQEMFLPVTARPQDLSLEQFEFLAKKIFKN